MPQRFPEFWTSLLNSVPSGGIKKKETQVRTVKVSVIHPILSRCTHLLTSLHTARRHRAHGCADVRSYGQSQGEETA